GNSGSQAATLITRAMALGQVGLHDWFRVFRHELTLGLMLGLSLGAVGFMRAAFTPPKVLHNTERRKDDFQIAVNKTEPLQEHPDGTYEIPRGEERLVIKHGHPIHVKTPDQQRPTKEEDSTSGALVYTFPAQSEVSYEAVKRWDLASILALAITMICLWGT